MRLLDATVLAATLLASTTAFADVPAETQALFDQGIKDMQAGKLDAACKELAAALARYPDMGIKGALATCYTKAHKTASAWTLWRELADTETDAARKASAGKHASELEPKLAHFTIRLAATVPGLVVMVNDTRVTDPTLSVPIPVDPGALAVRAQAPGYAPWFSTIDVAESQTTMIDVPVLVTANGAMPTPQAIDPIVLAARGRAALEQHRYSDAVRDLRLSYQNAPDPELLFAIGEAFRSEEDPSDALDAYQHYLVDAPEGPNATAAQAHVDELKQRVEHDRVERDSVHTGLALDLHVGLGVFSGANASDPTMRPSENSLAITAVGGLGAYVWRGESIAVGITGVAEFGVVLADPQEIKGSLGGGVVVRAVHSGTYARIGAGFHKIQSGEQFGTGMILFVDGLYELGRAQGIRYGVSMDARYVTATFTPFTAMGTQPQVDTSGFELALGVGAVFR